jgi:V8-like Glu-specific endopeptidase
MRLRVRLPCRRGRLVLAAVGAVAGAVAGAAALGALGSDAASPAGDAIQHVRGSFLQLTSDSPTGQAFSGVAAVGALFPAAASPAAASPAGTTTGSASGLGAHFCTASVVDSPAGNLAVTAAHCVTGKALSVVFVPGYHNGQAPYGTWRVTRIFTDAAWSASADPDDDVAFLQLAPNADGVNVESVTGAERLEAGSPDRALVKVIGYPSDTDEPVWCVNWTREFSSTQLVFDCGGYPDGTSGGPFLTDVSPVSGDGTVIGVIGGYQQGGDTDAVSYSIVFGANVASLYQEAEAGGLPGRAAFTGLCWAAGRLRRARRAPPRSAASPRRRRSP